MDDTRRIPASQPLFTALTDAFVEGEAGTTYDPHPDPLWLTPGPDARVACEPGQGLTAAAISSRRPVPLVSWASTSVGHSGDHMSWLLFIDESGHDHRSMPYEVRGGLAIHSSKLWEFTKHIQALEISYFGKPRHEFGSEIKGDILLKKRRFKYAAQNGTLENSQRRQLTDTFLKSTIQKKNPRGYELKAYAETCINFSSAVLDSLKSFDCYIFASFIPPDNPPAAAPPPENFLRKDHVFLLERYFYFLKAKKDLGLIIMDGTEKSSDRRFIRGLERYFQNTQTGKERSKRIVPVPLFVESDMGYGVQIADLCIYCLNYSYRVPNIGLDAPFREELKPFAAKVQSRIWQGKIWKRGHRHHIHSVVYVHDPYTSRTDTR